MRFDGMGVKLPVHPSLDLGTKYTFMVWIRPERHPAEGHGAVIPGKELVTTGNPWAGVRLALEHSGAVGFNQTNGSKGTFQPIFSARPIPLNEWTHIGLTSREIDSLGRPRDRLGGVLAYGQRGRDGRSGHVARRVVRTSLLGEPPA